MNPGRKKHIAILLIGLFMGFSFGFVYGATTGVKWAVKMGINFLKVNGYELEPDIEEIVYNAESYKFNLDRCYG